MKIIMIISLLLLLVEFVTPAVITEGHPYTGVIQPYETQQIELTTTGGLKRVLYYQCTGTADLTIVDVDSTEVETFKDLISKGDDCENGKMFSCFADPCSVTTCPNYANAVCTSNYCGGCNAEFRVDNQLVLCTDSGSADDIVYATGAPAHMAVIDFADSTYTFNLLGKRSDIDTVNSYQLYVFDNKESDKTHAILESDAEVYIAVDNGTLNLSWTAPVADTGVVIKQYCIFWKETELNTKLNGNWLACGHEVKSAASPLSCVETTEATIENLSTNSSHYIWIVAYTMDDVTTTYPFVRVDLQPPAYNRTVIISVSYLLLYLVLTLLSF